MPVITLQLGQCGNQLGYSFYQALGTELSTGEYHASGLDEWFRQVQPRLGSATHVARSVLIDMEPKVVNSVVSAAATASASSAVTEAARGWWRYPQYRQLCMSSGAGNNWAHGYHGYGPCVREAALDMIQKEAEACDVMGGFLLLQSMAGGTGAGLGAYVAHALRDEYPAAASLNCCVWPYESGEVIVQPYNTLLTLSALSASSDGVVVMENEALHRAAHRLYGIARPSFSDMNLVAARSLTSLLLPSHSRPVTPMHLNAAVNAARGAAAASMAARSMSQLQTHKSNTHSPGAGTDVPLQGGCSMGQPVRMLPELLGHVCCHPGHRLLSLRALPQMPASSVDFTTFTWPALMKRLRQMLLTGSSMEEGMDWGMKTATHTSQHYSDMGAAANGCVTPPASRPAPGVMQSSSSATPGGSGSMSGSAQQHRVAGGQPGSGGHASANTRAAASRSSVAAATTSPAYVAGSSRRVNKAVSSWLVLRGQGAADVDVGITGLSDAGLYPSWSVDPLAVSCHPARFARCDMAAALLAADQAAVQPAVRMLERAYSMFSSRAYVHQYQEYGLEADDFTACFAAVEDVVSRYDLL